MELSTTNAGGILMTVIDLLRADPATLNEAQLQERRSILAHYTQEEAELYYGATCQEDRERAVKTIKERWERGRRESRRERWQSSKAGQALQRFREAFLEYKACLEGNSYAAGEATEFDEPSQRLFNRLRSTIEKANHAPRCQRVMGNGRRCRAPRVRGKKLCHMHQAMLDARPERFDLPSLDNANDIQVAIAKIAQALVDGKLQQKEASTLTYVLQVAVNNLGRMDFEDADFEVVDFEEGSEGK